IGVNGDGLQRSRRWFTRKAGDLDIAESMNCERRLILFDSLSGGDEVVGGFCRAQVLQIHRPIGVQNLGESQLDVRSRRTLHAKSRHTAEILAKIKNEDAG